MRCYFWSRQLTKMITHHLANPVYPWNSYLLLVPVSTSALKSTTFKSWLATAVQIYSLLVPRWESDKPRELKVGRIHCLASSVIGDKLLDASPTSRWPELGHPAGSTAKTGPVPFFLYSYSGPCKLLFPVPVPSLASSPCRRRCQARLGLEKDERSEAVSLCFPC